jgi:undecaprenyl-diphosphatase
VAVTIAVACGVFPSLPIVGLLLFLCAASIAVACVVGRYHYTVDVLAGAALGLGVCAVAAAFGA